MTLHIARAVSIHFSISISGKDSEKIPIASLNSDRSNSWRNCCKIAMPTNNGNEDGPTKILSQRWYILSSGKMSNNHSNSARQEIRSKEISIDNNEQKTYE